MPNKNPAAKMRKDNAPYERWTTPDRSWRWDVLKKWQADDNKPFARWFCKVYSPFVPEGEMGDVYVSEIKAHAVMVMRDATYAQQLQELAAVAA